jgi:flagellar biosynthetic protein FlhB
MADDKDESQQTEQPSQRKLDQAAEHGDVIKSQEVTTLLALLGSTLTLGMFAQSTAMDLMVLFRGFLAEPELIAMDPGSLRVMIAGLLMKLAAIVGPFFGMMIASGLVANMIQNRPQITLDRIKPDLAKLSLLKGLTRMFGMEGIVNIIKGIIKMGIVAIAIWTQLWPERDLLEAALTQSPAAIAGDMTHLLFRVLIATLACLIVIAGGDYVWQYFQYMKRNKMSKQEVKDEYKQTEGDPHIKGKIKQIRLEKAKQRMMAAVPKATVVITNPTHYAVALHYESGKTQAPICVAKGNDALALRIREMAKKHNVPVVENPPLARALYAAVEIDEPIPGEHFKAVAQVIGYVMKLRG